MKGAVLIFGWVLVVHGIWLMSGLDTSLPASIFFQGDSAHFLAQSCHLAEGKAYNASLPFHPPLTAWALVPLWRIFSCQEVVWLASKIVMMVINGLTIALLFVLVRPFVPHALLLCLLLPFSFGELLLSSSVNSEGVYRLLLVIILWLGFRCPLLGGVLNACACLTRAEHLWLLVLLFIIGLLIRSYRGFLLKSMIGCMLVLVPYTMWTAQHIARYNGFHQQKLVKPLPLIVPITLYGPLNFALAQEGSSLFFSRSSLPSPEGSEAQLDPLFPPHNEYITAGYAIGFKWIVTHPRVWLVHLVRKVFFSLRALSFGWTWRDFPNQRTWMRPPVDMAHSFSLFYFILSCSMLLVGVVKLRGQPVFLLIGGAFLLYRLGTNAIFFPYLRSMMIVSPWWLLLMLTGLSGIFKGWSKRVLIGLLVLFSLMHGFTLLGDRDYYIRGKTDRHGRIIQDDELTITYAGFYHDKGEGR